MNTVIHAAFRRDLSRFDDALSSFDGSATRAADLGRAWDNVDAQLRHHHEDEETLFWPALVKLGVDESLVSDLESTRAVRKAHPGEAGTFFAWLADGADADSRALLRSEAAPPVLFVLSRVAGRSYHQRIAPVWS